jgi:FdhD protein
MVLPIAMSVPDQAPAKAQKSPPGSEAIALRRVRKATSRAIEDVDDAVAVERWLRVILNGREVSAVMASPGREDELGAGFALTQGLIRSRADLLSVGLRADAEKGDAVRIVIPLDLSRAVTERLVARGSCGGQVLVNDTLPVIERDAPVVAAALLRDMARAMAAAQEIYKRTGGTHAAGVFTPNGEMVVVREDVSRHNALDKALGHCLLSGHRLEDKVAIMSGRASREIVASAARAGVPILASISAATDAGVDIAARARVTLVSFLRGRRMNVCAHPQRIDLGR